MAPSLSLNPTFGCPFPLCAHFRVLFCFFFFLSRTFSLSLSLSLFAISSSSVLHCVDLLLLLLLCALLWSSSSLVAAAAADVVSLSSQQSVWSWSWSCLSQVSSIRQRALLLVLLLYSNSRCTFARFLLFNKAAAATETQIVSLCNLA